ncbi:MAG: MerR family transcriptional regulator [Actinomycetota bacterium]|nr:MerR family transcriptional regulator [Actinomycetota bacterium]
MTMRIAEIAHRSGFSAATLRYYEQLDLLPPPRRTAAGHRSYDESILSRLAFIRRAKMLDCSLEEVAALMPEWDDGRCAPVQGRLRQVAAAKLAEADLRVAELAGFTADLRRMLATLGSHTPDGPCDADCGCLTDAPPPVACTLAASAVPARIQDWNDLAALVVGRAAVDGGVRLQLDPAVALDELALLVRAEQACCAFFAFALTVDGRGVALEVRAPAEGMAMVDALFGDSA